jgi:transposase-like protein
MQVSMVQIRKHYSPTFKAQVVQEVLAGEKSLGQIAAQYGIHPNMISKWRRAVVEAMPEAFDEESQRQAQAQMAALKAQHEREKEELHAEIGRLTMQVKWLQKKIAAGTTADYTPGDGRAKRSRTAPESASQTLRSEPL